MIKFTVLTSVYLAIRRNTYKVALAIFHSGTEFTVYILSSYQISSYGFFIWFGAPSHDTEDSPFDLKSIKMLVMTPYIMYRIPSRLYVSS